MSGTQNTTEVNTVEGNKLNTLSTTIYPCMKYVYMYVHCIEYVVQDTV